MPRLRRLWRKRNNAMNKVRHLAGISVGQQKPVVLAFVYYGCPMLCDQVEQGVVGALRMLSFNPGRDYDVVFVSFDSRETPDMAAEKKKKALAHFRRPETDSGWHFLTGSKDSIEAATRAANFRFSFDARNNLFAHASGVAQIPVKDAMKIVAEKGLNAAPAPAVEKKK